MNPDNGLYRAAQVRELDRRAIEDFEIAGLTLMRRAGSAAFRAFRARFPEARELLVCTGGGNNGGDGYIVAGLARQAGLHARVIALKPPDQLSGDARAAAEEWLDAGGAVSEWSGTLPEADVIVDALLGTGLDSDVRGAYAEVIDAINQASAGVLAIDLPSGLHADTGCVLGAAVRADVTVTFIGRKRGLDTGDAANWRGDVVFASLDVPDGVYDDFPPDAWRADADLPRRLLPARRPSAHKGDSGHVLICGGDFNMPGALVLAARAALLSGSGLVSVATRQAHAVALATGCAEAMWASGEDGATLDMLLERADVLALGPGLGRSDWSRSVYDRLLATDRPMVLDADGLNLLAENPRARDHWILTPHPGEAGRLLDVATAEIQRDRFAAARALAERYRAVVVLKGAGTLVADPGGELMVCPFGNPAMATAGMGDALTGIIASLVGQGLTRFDAACAGVVLHARAGDAIAAGRRVILAGELIDALPRLLP